MTYSLTLSVLGNPGRDIAERDLSFLSTKERCCSRHYFTSKGEGVEWVGAPSLLSCLWEESLALGA